MVVSLFYNCNVLFSLNWALISVVLISCCSAFTQFRSSDSERTLQSWRRLLHQVFVLRTRISCIPAAQRACGSVPPASTGRCVLLYPVQRIVRQQRPTGETRTPAFADRASRKFIHTHTLASTRVGLYKILILLIRSWHLKASFVEASRHSLSYTIKYFSPSYGSFSTVFTRHPDICFLVSLFLSFSTVFFQQYLQLKYHTW